MEGWMPATACVQARIYAQNSAPRGTRQVRSIDQGSRNGRGAGKSRKRYAMRSVRAARKQRNQNHQVRQREQPLVGLRACSFCRARDHPKMTAAREVVQVLHADASQAGYFRVGENFLTRFDGDQGLPHVRSNPSPPLTCFVMLSAG